MSLPNEQNNSEDLKIVSDSKKPKKNKKKVATSNISELTKTTSEDSGAISTQLAAELVTKIQLLQTTSSTTAAKDISDAKQHNYQFWTTQPVPNLG